MLWTYLDFAFENHIRSIQKIAFIIIKDITYFFVLNKCLKLINNLK
jgi:hypothetical protein